MSLSRRVPVKFGASLAETSHSVPPRSDRSRRRGRRIAQILYYAGAGALCVAATVQITRQVYFADTPPEANVDSCRQGLLALHGAIEAGREEAAKLPDASQEQALRAYRGEVEPGWHERQAVENLCQGDAEALGTLDALGRLRYAEEQGVRGRAAELSALRQRVRQRLVGKNPDG